MHDGKLMEKIDRAILLDRMCEEVGKELKLLKKEIADEAATRDEERVPTPGGGESWTMAGTDGCVCRVTLPAPTLAGSVKQASKSFPKIMELCGKCFPRLFEQAPAFKPVEKFREEAVRLLGQRSGGSLIRLCESKSTPTVSFETKEKAEKN